MPTDKLRNYIDSVGTFLAGVGFGMWVGIAGLKYIERQASDDLQKQEYKLLLIAFLLMILGGVVGILVKRLKTRTEDFSNEREES
jgi:uncharacterized membrane protein